MRRSGERKNDNHNNNDGKGKGTNKSIGDKPKMADVKGIRKRLKWNRK